MVLRPARLEVGHYDTEAVAGGATIMYSNRMNIRPKLSVFTP